MVDGPLTIYNIHITPKKKKELYNNKHKCEDRD